MIKWLFILIIICNSCNTGSASIISLKKMQQVLWDVMRADALAHQLSLKDSTIKLSAESKRLCAQVFLIHNITEEQFKKSYLYYTGHPDEMKIITDSISIQQARRVVSAFTPKRNLTVDSSNNATKLK